MLETFEKLDAIIHYARTHRDHVAITVTQPLPPAPPPLLSLPTSFSLGKSKDREKDKARVSNRARSGSGAAFGRGFLSLSSAKRREPSNNTSEAVDEVELAHDELVILESALSRLFESTKYLDDAALVNVLSALGTLSLSSLANAATNDHDSSSVTPASPLPTTGTGSASVSITSRNPASAPTAASSSAASTASTGRGTKNPVRPVHVFALVNLVATIEHNMFRIGSSDIWSYAVGHLNSVITHRDASFRKYGVESLTKLIVPALSNKEPVAVAVSNRATHIRRRLVMGADREEVKASVPSQSSHSTGLSPSPTPPFQVQILAPLVELYRSKYDDTREHILNAIFLLLQSTGHTLNDGWLVVLHILQLVVKGGVCTEIPELTSLFLPTSHSTPPVTVLATLPPSITAGILPPIPSSVFTVDTSQSYESSSPPMSLSSLESNAPSTPISTASLSQVQLHIHALSQLPPAPALVALGFRSLELIVNDFLDVISYDHIQLLVTTVGFYCSQRFDTNISFTSIGVLWRISDYVDRVVGVPIKKALHNRAPPSRSMLPPSTDDHDPTPTPGVSDRRGSQTEDAASASASAFVEIVLTASLADSLIIAIFKELALLSVDNRSEVRNSAVKTLHSTFTTHGNRMKPEVWVACLEDILFPLLYDLLSTDEERTSQVAQGIELGKERGTGKSVMMLVHYSRDTAEKQWNESRVIALQGSTRVFRLLLKVCCAACGRR